MKLDYTDKENNLLILEKLTEKESLKLISKGMGNKIIRALKILSRLGLG